MTVSSPATATPARFNRLDFTAALGVVVLWGLNFVVMKLALREFTPWQLGALRYAFAALPLVLLVPRPRLHPGWLLAYGLFQGVGQFGLLFLALKVGMTAALASVLMQTQVFFTALFGLVMLRERPGRPQQAGLALAALGLGCFAMNYAGGGAAGAAVAATTVAGFVLNLVAASMWAASNIVARRAQQAAPDFQALGFVVWASLVPILPFIGFSLMFDPPELRWRWLEASWMGWASAAYLGWLATVLGYSLWTGLLQRHPANRVAPFSLGVPVIGLAAGMGLLGEPVTGWQWAGAALVVAALAATVLGPRLAAAWRPRQQAA